MSDAKQPAGPRRRLPDESRVASTTGRWYRDFQDCLGRGAPSARRDPAETVQLGRVHRASRHYRRVLAELRHRNTGGR